MPLFRHKTQKPDYYLEYGWEGASCYKSPIVVRVAQKMGDKHKVVEELGTVNYEKEQAKAGYTFESKNLGKILIKWVRKLLIIEKIEVYINGEEAKGNEAIKMWTIAGDIGEIS
ncbi:hypothetical protein HOE67_03435 [Candidatus Peregrinibacteria bacterium]|jgi:hypothetical protein|nr:hypothetical protein [Candidatus Peregrinibacteria bacterium]MBT4056137.1 hypothetical protein [Candidatus Peregrinibacteria bacterium]